jgi:hypothetical protein
VVQFFSDRPAFRADLGSKSQTVAVLLYVKPQLGGWDLNKQSMNLVREAFALAQSWAGVLTGSCSTSLAAAAAGAAANMAAGAAESGGAPSKPSTAATAASTSSTGSPDAP